MAMPADAPPVLPRWPLPHQNGTTPTTTPAPSLPDAQPAEVTPSTIPEPVYESVTVVSADRLPASTSHPPIPQYPGSGATLLQGYCTEPAYTILDGPTAVWVPVVGCISSKADCCPTSTKSGSGPAPTSGGPGDGAGEAGSGAEFPISFMPSQGTLTGCPKDYHTVGKTACCPSSYWLWSTELGGQVPCYSSLRSKLTPPPIPDTLVQDTTGTDSHTGTITGSATTRVPALTMTRKPTSAIVNVAYAMQYQMSPEPKPALKKEAKIGIGVGVSGGAVLIAVLALLVVRKFFAHKKTRDALTETSVGQRFGHGVDMSRVAHQEPPMSRTYGGAKYAGVPTRGV